MKIGDRVKVVKCERISSLFPEYNPLGQFGTVTGKYGHNINFVKLDGASDSVMFWKEELELC